MPQETPPVVSNEPATGATIILPRAEAPPEPAPASAKGVEQIAEEARVKMAKTQGFWNRLAPEKEKKEPPASETPPAEPAAATPEPEKKPKKGKDGKAEAEPLETPPEPEKVKRRQPKTEVDPLQIAEATGRAIASEMARTKPAAPATPEPEVPELPEEFRRDTAVFEEMARQDPKRYGNIKKELAKYAASEDQYIQKWEAEHQGETFDGDAPEHNEFYERIKPNYDQADFEAAKTTLIENRAAERATKAAREEFKKEYEAREQQRAKVAQIEPELDREIFGLLGEMAREADPTQGEFKDWAAIRALDQKNSLLADVMVAVHDRTKPLLATNMRVWRFVEPYDDQNPAHRQIAEMVEEAEKRILQLPPRDRYHDDGRMFTTHEAYKQMTPAQKQQHWYIGEEETAAIIRGQAKRDTKALYERESDRFKRYATNGAATASPNPPATKEDASTPPPKPETKADTASPSVTGRGSLPGDGQPAAKTPQTGQDWFYRKYTAA